MAASLAASESAERQGQLGRAYEHAEAAFNRARQGGGPPYPGLDDLKRRRDRLSQRDAHAQLAKASLAPPQEAVGLIKSLASRASSDSALSSLAGQINAKLKESTAHHLEVQLAEARTAFADRRFDTMLELCEQILATPLESSGQNPDAVHARTRDLLSQAIAHSGLVIEPTRGQMIPGLSTPETYAKDFQRSLTDVLRRGGYLIAPSDSPLRALWTERAPNRLSIEINEQQADYFEQSTNRTSRIEAKFTLTRHGSSLWQGRAVGRTRNPPQGLTSYEFAYLSVAGKQSPDVEKRLYQDAKAALLDAVPGKIQSLPPAQTPDQQSAQLSGPN